MAWLHMPIWRVIQISSGVCEPLIQAENELFKGSSSSGLIFVLGKMLVHAGLVMYSYVYYILSPSHVQSVLCDV